MPLELPQVAFGLVVMEEIDVKVMVDMCGGIKIKALCIRVLFLVNYLL